MSREVQHVVELQRELLFAHRFGGAFEVREAIALGFLVGAYQQVGELLARRAGLSQLFRNRDL